MCWGPLVSLTISAAGVHLAHAGRLLYTPPAFNRLFPRSMLVIRLQRTGRENTPTFRIVVSEKARSAKKGTLEILGHFLPSREKPVFECKQDRVEYWISKGAKPSDTLARHLKHAGMKNMEKFMVRYTKKKSKNEEAAAPTAPAAASPAAAAPAAAESAPIAEEAPKAA